MVETDWCVSRQDNPRQHNSRQKRFGYRRSNQTNWSNTSDYYDASICTQFPKIFSKYYSRMTVKMTVFKFPTFH